VDCPKLFPLVTPPPPQTSNTPSGRRRRGVSPKALTKRSLLEERKAALKRSRADAKKRSIGTTSGIRIRGRWVSTGMSCEILGLLCDYS